MRKQLLSALVATMTWVGFDGSGHVGSTAQAWGGVPCNLWVTGGGRVDVVGDDSFWTFGFNALFNGGHHITAVNHTPGSGGADMFFCGDVTITACECGIDGGGALVEFTGVLFEHGQPTTTTCTVTVIDRGEPGTSDEIFFSGPATFAGTLFGGNVQVHPVHECPGT